MQRPRRLAHFLDDHRISQIQVGEALGLDSSSVSRKLAGTQAWKLTELRSLLEFLTRHLGREVQWDDILEPVAAEAEVAR